MRSSVQNCNGILHGISAKNLGKLQKVQNMLARVVTGKRRFDHINPVLRDLYWLPIAQRVDFKLATIVFKVRLLHQPKYLAALLTDYEPSRTLRSTNKQYLCIPRSRTVLASRRFSSAAPVIWNGLPLDIRTCDKLDCFRRKLKTHFFKLAFF